MTKIVIQPAERPSTNAPQEIIKWICVELGLSNGTENDTASEKLLEELAEAASDRRGLTSSELKINKEMARSTVIYHLNRLIEAGLVVKKGRYYYLRTTQLAKTLEEINYDIEREMKRMIETAREFDLAMSRRLRLTNKR